MSKIKSTPVAARKIIVKNVRVGDSVQSVRFAHLKDRSIYMALTKNHAPIRVRFDEEAGKFTAGNRSGSVTAKTAADAFAKAAREIWVN